LNPHAGAQVPKTCVSAISPLPLERHENVIENSCTGA